MSSRSSRLRSRVAGSILLLVGLPAAGETICIPRELKARAVQGQVFCCSGPQPTAYGEAEILVSQVGSRESWRVATSVEGRFSVDVPPGVYVVEAKAKVGGARPARVTVTKPRSTHPPDRELRFVLGLDVADPCSGGTVELVRKPE